MVNPSQFKMFLQNEKHNWFTIIGSRRWYGDFISGSIEAQVLGSCGWDVDGGGCGAGLRVDSVEEAGALWRRIEFHVPPIQIQ